jgi:hypothetical protein
LNSYNLPFGKGEKFLGNAGRLLNAVVGNWTIADDHSYHSGSLIALNCTNTLGSGVLFTDARMCNTNGGQVLTGASRTSLDPNNPSSLYFNAGAFSVPGQYSFGTSAQYNSKFRQPPVLTDNFALIKQFMLVTKGDNNLIRLQVRADAANMFNRTNFGVNGTVGNANFGRATGPQYSPRIITMGLRLYF